MSPRNLNLKFAICVSLCSAAFPAAGWAQQPLPRPETFQKLIDCKSVADASSRLACFDKQVAELEAAERDSSVVVVDKKQLQRADKGLFGLNLPSLGGLLGRGEKKEEAVSAIETTIKSATQTASGRWLIVLDDGARWIQTETQTIFDPKPGQKIRIRKAAFGSYFANINGQTAIRMSRQNQ